MIVFHSTSRAADKTNKIQISEKIRRSAENQKNVQISETFLTFQKIWPPCIKRTNAEYSTILYYSQFFSRRRRKKTFFMFEKMKCVAYLYIFLVLYL
jgi:hypothetical protein